MNLRPHTTIHVIIMLHLHAQMQASLVTGAARRASLRTPTPGNKVESNTAPQMAAQTTHYLLSGTTCTCAKTLGQGHVFVLSLPKISTQMQRPSNCAWGWLGEYASAQETSGSIPIKQKCYTYTHTYTHTHTRAHTCCHALGMKVWNSTQFNS